MSRWSSHQQRMLGEMGLRLWSPAGAAAPLSTAELPAAATASVIAPMLAPEIASEIAPPTAPMPVPMAMPMPTAPQAMAPPRAASRPDAQAIAGLDWPDLRSAVAGCQACGLCQTRQQTVFGVGHVRAHCLVVGEAPGEQEDAQGEPFVGASGQLLDRMLAALGLSRQPGDPARQVYLSNILKCHPPGHRNPSPAELALCQPFLQRQVALLQPRVMLVMGRFAVQSLLGSDAPIGKLRGRVHRWQGVPMVVTHHPDYLLRQPQAKADAWDDLCRAAQLLAAAPS